MVRRSTPKEQGSKKSKNPVSKNVVKMQDVVKEVRLSREEAICVVNLVTIGTKLAPCDPPDDVVEHLEAAMNRILNTFGLVLCDCCDLVRESHHQAEDN
jgi:hypothetical protein